MVGGRLVCIPTPINTGIRVHSAHFSASEKSASAVLIRCIVMFGRFLGFFILGAVVVFCLLIWLTCKLI